MKPMTATEARQAAQKFHTDRDNGQMDRVREAIAAASATGEYSVRVDGPLTVAVASALQAEGYSFGPVSYDRDGYQTDLIKW